VRKNRLLPIPAIIVEDAPYAYGYEKQLLLAEEYE
jgi:hypothetical protein